MHANVCLRPHLSHFNVRSRGASGRAWGAGLDGVPISQVLGDFFDSAVFNFSFFQIMLIHNHCGFSLSACSAVFGQQGQHVSHIFSV